MQLTFGDRMPGLTVGAQQLHAAVFNENEVRAAAGITLVVGATAVSFALFEHQYGPLQVVTTFFFFEFLIRLLFGIRHSPVGVIARWMTRNQPPQWVSAKPKRFAWKLGLAMAFSMVIITNSGMTGLLPGTLCATCMVLMWMESVLGVCLGCKLHALMMRRGWRDKDPEIEVCSHGACQLPARPVAAQ